MNGQVAIAKELGLHQSTVSRAIKHPERVNEETRNRVLEAVRKRGYQLNELPNRLRAGGLQMLGACVSWIQNEFFVALIHGVELAASRHGWSVVIECTHNDLDAELRSITEMRSLRFGGLIILPHPQATDLYRELKRSKFPFVFVDRSLPGISVPWVGTDDRLGGRLAAEHVFKLGHRRIARIYGPQDYGSFAERGRGTVEFFAEKGLTLDPRWEIAGHAMELKEAALPAAGLDMMSHGFATERVERGRRAMARLLELPAQQRPTAVLCDNDYYATGALLEATSRGVAVPEAISIVGFAGFSWTRWLPVPLTTVVQPAQQIGEEAAELLINVNRRGTPRRPRKQLLPPRLEASGSTGPCP